MKNVFLLLDGHPSRDLIREYFAGINASVTNLDPRLSADELRKKEPELFVLAEEHATYHILYRLKNYATIVITDDGTPGDLISSPGKTKRATATWPVKEEDFLRLSAEMARLSQRRLFSAIVRIFSTESDGAYMGQSIDFSSSGMAFRAKENFCVGDVLDISLSLPSRNENLKLPVEITRIVERREREESVYGARFTGMDGTTHSRLRNFISGG